MPDDEPKPVKTTQQTQPWAEQIPLWKQSFSDLNKLKASGGLRVNPFPGQTYAGSAPETGQAWQQIAQRAQAGSPVLQGANDLMQRTISGEFLNAEAPGIASIKDKARTAVNSNFAGMGRQGSGAHDAKIAAELAGIDYQNYAAERGIQDAAMRFAPQFAMSDYQDAQMLGSVGKERQADLQNQINAEIDRYNALQQAPINELALYQNLIGGNLGGTTKGTQPGQSNGNPWLSALGGLGMLGASFMGS
jgi:hypothetical protein